jgi:hypothetical protein
MDPRKVAAVVDWPPLTNQRDLRAFLGLAGYYCRFIDDFSHIATPLTDLLRADVPSEWGEKQQQLMDQLKLYHVPPHIHLLQRGMKTNSMR